MWRRGGRAAVAPCDSYPRFRPDMGGTQRMIRDRIHEIERHWKMVIRGFDIRDMAGPVRWNVLQNSFGRDPMGINKCDPFPVVDVLDGQVFEQGALAHAGFADHVEVFESIVPRQTDRLVIKGIRANVHRGFHGKQPTARRQSSWPYDRRGCRLSPLYPLFRLLPECTRKADGVYVTIGLNQPGLSTAVTHPGQGNAALSPGATL